MSKKKMMKEVTLAEREDMISECNLAIMDCRDSIKGLKILSEAFHIAVLENGYYGPIRGTAEYHSMVSDSMLHIIAALDEMAAKLDATTTKIDRALLGIGE